MPLALRFAVSAIPAYFLYRVLPILYRVPYKFLFAQGPMHRGRRWLLFPGFVGLLIILTGIAGLFLFQVWRGVTLDDWKRGRDSN
jgi:hypothetical protein